MTEHEEDFSGGGQEEAEEAEGIINMLKLMMPDMRSMILAYTKEPKESDDGYVAGVSLYGYIVELTELSRSIEDKVFLSVMGSMDEEMSEEDFDEDIEEGEE